MKNIFLFISFILFSLNIQAQENSISTEENKKAITELSKSNPLASQLTTLVTFAEQKDSLLLEIKTLKKQLNKTSSIEEKNELKNKLSLLKQDLISTRAHLREIAAGIDLSSLNEQEEEAFDFQKELFALIKPAVNEMKEMTAHVRKKSTLKESIAYYTERLKVLKQAIENIEHLQKNNTNKSVDTSLNFTRKNLEKKRAYMRGELKADQLQFNRLLAKETSLAEASESWAKSFFQKRGLYLTEAILSIFAIILLSKMSYTAMKRYLPGFRVRHRSFKIRLIELIHRLLTFVFIIIGPMVIFYIVEDWVLFSLGILLLIGFAWTLRLTIPYYWKQFYLFLNIGSVREGERLLLDGLPWQVKKINMYCTFVNPTADLTMRVPIQDLVELKSRPCHHDEPWFPCKKDDWVILNDGFRGKVIGLSQEMIQLVERGGTMKMYQMSDFLSASPRNLSANFRIKEIIGISYELQQNSTSQIPETLRLFLQKSAETEGYGEQLLSLKVEFERANNSSLDLVVIADFKGEVADLYNRLRRAIQRWSVEACSENNWEIPFPQMSLHHSAPVNID